MSPDASMNTKSSREREDLQERSGKKQCERTSKKGRQEEDSKGGKKKGAADYQQIPTANAG